MEEQAVQLKYQRILLKLSGEALQGDNLFGIDASKLGRLAEELASLLGLDRILFKHISYVSSSSVGSSLARSRSTSTSSSCKAARESRPRT